MTAPVNQLIDPKINKELATYITGVDAAVKKTLALVDATKLLIKNNETIASATKKNKDKIKELTEEQKAAKTVSKQLNAADGKLIQLNDKRQKQLIQSKKLNTERNKQLRDQAILQDKNSGSLEKLGAKNRLLNAEAMKLNLTTEKGKKRLAEINTQLDKNNATIDKSSDKFKKQKRGIGDYASAWGGVPGPIAAVGAAMKALLANPVVAIMAGIVAVFALFRKALTRSEEGQDRLNKISRVFGSIIDNIMDLVTSMAIAVVDAFKNPKQAILDFGNVLVDNVVNRFKGIAEAAGNLSKIFVSLFKRRFGEAKDAAADLGRNLIQIGTGLDKATQKKFVEGFKAIGKEMNEDAKAAQRLADSEARLHRMERAHLVENEKLRKESSDFRRQAEVLKKVEAEAAIEILEKSFDLDEKILTNELKLANLRASNLRLQSSLANDDIEAKKEIAEAEADIFRVETAFNEKRRQRTRRLNIFRLEAFKQETERSKTQIELLKVEADATINKNNIILDSEIATAEEKTAALLENAELVRSIIARETIIEISELDKRRELNLINEKDYLLQLQLLRAKSNADEIVMAQDTQDELNEIKEEQREKDIEQEEEEAEKKEEQAEKDKEAQAKATENKLAVVQGSEQILRTLIDGNARKDIKALEEKRKKGTITEKQYEKEREAIEKKAAKRNKLITIAKIIIENALSLAQFNFPKVAAGVAALVTAIATPAFEHGGIMPFDGKAKTGEAGREIYITPNGDVGLTKNYANTTNWKAGTEFIKNSETEKRLAASGGQIATLDVAELRKGQKNDTKQIVKAIRETSLKNNSVISQQYIDKYLN